MPTNDIPMPQSDQGTSSAGIGEPSIEKNSEPPAVQEKEKELSQDEFIPDITEDAKPTQNIQAIVQYPETARHGGLEGKVTFSALIGKDGRVEKVTIDKADFEVFKQPVIDAVMKVRFTPARQNQTPVRVWYIATVNFKLH
jgi:TonB family protein